MATYNVNRETGDLIPVSGGTLYADNPVGTILPYGGSVAPAGWLICDGSALNRTTYAELFSVIGTNFGVGDGSTTFNLPDMREAVPKGAGLTGKNVGNHYDTDGLAVGEFVDDRLQNHAHFIMADGGGAYLRASGSYTSNGETEATSLTGRINTNTARAGVTTEVKSVGVSYIIKAQRVAVPADFVNSIEDTLSDMGIGTIVSKVDTNISIASGASENCSVDLTTGKWIVTANVECNSSISTLITTRLAASNNSMPSSFTGRFNALSGGGICLTQIANVTTSTAQATSSIDNNYSTTLIFRCRMYAIRVA